MCGCVQVSSISGSSSEESSDEGEGDTHTGKRAGRNRGAAAAAPRVTFRAAGTHTHTHTRARARAHTHTHTGVLSHASVLSVLTSLCVCVCVCVCISRGADGQLFCVWRCLVERDHVRGHTEPLTPAQHLTELQRLRGGGSVFVVLLLRGGHVAAAGTRRTHTHTHTHTHTREQARTDDHADSGRNSLPDLLCVSCSGAVFRARGVPDRTPAIPSTSQQGVTQSTATSSTAAAVSTPSAPPKANHAQDVFEVVAHKTFHRYVVR